MATKKSKLEASKVYKMGQQLIKICNKVVTLYEKSMKNPLSTKEIGWLLKTASWIDENSL